MLLNTILQNNNLIISNYNDFIKIINMFIADNKKIFNKLSNQDQQTIGFEMLQLKDVKYVQDENLLAQSFFDPLKLGKDINKLFVIFKNLLLANVNLHLHLKKINKNDKKILEKK